MTTITRRHLIAWLQDLFEIGRLLQEIMIVVEQGTGWLLMSRHRFGVSIELLLDVLDHIRIELLSRTRQDQKWNGESDAQAE